MIAKIINAIVEVITSNEVVEASIEAVSGLVEGLIPAIVDILVNALPRIINFFIVKLPSYTPQLIVGIINALINAIAQMDFSELVSQFFTSFTQGIGNFGDTGGLTSSLKSLFKRVMSKEFWLGTLQGMVEALGQIIVELFSSIGDIVGGIFGGGSSNQWWDPFDWFATGTQSATKGLAVVGEAGPELVRFNGGEQVLNTKNTQKALAGAGGTTINQNVTFNNLQDTTAFAMMSQLKQYNRQLAINGIL